MLDQTGAAFPQVLVIVKSLQGGREIGRGLTDAAGNVPERELAPGLYRIIATCPYGICETKVVEFLVGDLPLQLELKLDLSPTKGYGDVVQVGPSRSLDVAVVDREGRPASEAQVLVRDSEARHERWYTSGSDGSVAVDLPDGPVTIVVLYRGALTARTVSEDAARGLRAKRAKLTITVGRLEGTRGGVSE